MSNGAAHSSGGGPDQVEIFLLGPLLIRVNGEEIAPLPRKARALLAYLVIRRGVAVPRETIMGLLWGERGDDQARASLRQTLSLIRKALGPVAGDLIGSDRESVTFAESGYCIDLGAIEQLGESADIMSLSEAVENIRGELLEGLSLSEPTYEQWLVTEREHARQMIARTRGQLAQLLEEAGRIDEAIEQSQNILKSDPAAEQTHRALMRLYMTRGQYEAALRQFKQCQSNLRDILGVEPQAETVEMQRQAKAGRKRNVTIPEYKVSNDSGTDKPSIAVLPFTNMSGDPEQEYFSDGISEDIITELSRSNSLFVVARNSSFQYRGDAVDVRQVGEQLGVGYVLEGSVRKSGERLRITAQLIDAASNDHLWAERYDGTTDDIFDLQDEVSRNIVSTLVGRLDDIQLDRITRQPTKEFSAYEEFLRGQKFMQKYSLQEYAKARSHFEKAIELDPDFARAHACLSLIGFHEWNGTSSEPALLDEALNTGTIALELDPHESRCHLALGVVYLFREEHEKANYHLGRAAVLNPNDDLVMIEQARYQMYTGRPMDGAEYVRLAMRRNPYFPNWYWNILGRCLHTARRHEAALSAFEKISTPQYFNHAYMAACNSLLGRETAAQQHIGKVLEKKPDFTLSDFSKQLPYRSEMDRAAFLDELKSAGLPD